MNNAFNQLDSRFVARCLLCAFAVIMLPGCADFIAARERHSQGWRQAQVDQIDTGAAITRFSFTDCRKVAAGGAAGSSTYVVYRYRGVTGRAYHIAPVPDGLPLKVGDAVLVNIENCLVPPTPR